MAAIGISDKDTKIKRICRLEGITLKQFSEETGIPYRTVKHYSSGYRNPGLEQIQKIISTPRFEQYKFMLLLEGEPTLENTLDVLKYHLEDKDTKMIEARELLVQLENAGRLDEATEIMKTLLKRANKQ